MAMTKKDFIELADYLRLPGMIPGTIAQILEAHTGIRGAENDEVAAALADGPHVCTPETCPDTGGYYVSAVDGPQWWKMAGPYQTHAQALADVDRARNIADKHDGRAWFMSWGTVRVADSCAPGNLNRAGLL